MVLQRLVSVSLAALSYSYALVLPSDRVLASSDTLSSLGCADLYIADGFCDLQNDNERCGYDGGDCCECTCVSTSDYTCGENGRGYACLDPSAPCVDDDEVTALLSSEVFCVASFIADGDCDPSTNTEGCGYDGGDCCACTCVSTSEYTCGDDEFGGFDCLDPKARCSDDDDDSRSVIDVIIDRVMDVIAALIRDGDDDDELPEISSYASSCLVMFFGDGDCDSANNNDECGYDGGDCCECDCTSNSISTGGLYNAFDCIDPTSPCVNGYIEAGTKTTVGVSANAYNTRPGQASGYDGCMVGGCAPGLTRDGSSDDVESRWSCAQEIVPEGGLCEIEFTFESPQDIKEVQVAFWKGDERSRTLEAAINGEVVGSFDSYRGSTFNALGIEGSGVHTLTLTPIGLNDDEWTSLLEVRFLVEPLDGQ